MFVIISIFRQVTAGKEGEFLFAQEAFSRAMKGLRGFRDRQMLRDEKKGSILALTTWDSQDDFQAAGPQLMKYRGDENRAGRDFSKLLDEPEELYFLTPIDSMGPK